MSSKQTIGIDTAKPHSLNTVPMRTHNACRLTNPSRDDFDLLLRHSANIHLHVDCLINAEFSNDSPGQDIQVLEALDDPSDAPESASATT